MSPLNRAILKQKLEIVTFLIENGVDINEKDGKNWTLIDKAIDQVPTTNIYPILLFSY